MIILREIGGRIHGQKDPQSMGSRFRARISHGDKGDGWISLSGREWVLALKGVLKNVLALPFELYEISMGINREQTQGGGDTNRVCREWGDLLDVKRHDKRDRKHRGPNGQAPCLSGNERWGSGRSNRTNLWISEGKSARS